MLLQLKQPGEALTAFETTLTKEPNRFRALYGAAQAATDAGQKVKGANYYARLLKICPKADRPGRRELDQARHAAR